ncbi:MAG: MFS transporter, partial [Duncaniella sp.]|nr:MFS transporter [Duncaniella sp.]
TVCCPMLNLLGGGGNKGNQLLQSAGAFNSLAGTLTPLLVGVLIGKLTKETSMIEVAPLLIIGMAIFVVAGVIVYMVQIPEPGNNNTTKKVTYTHSPWNFRHTVLGVIAIFFYVGIEVGIPGTLNFYLADQTARGAGVIGDASAIAGAIVAIYWLLMLVGRSLSAVISAIVPTRTQLMTVASVAIILIVVSILIPKEVTMPVPEALYSGGATVPVSAMLLIFCGLCTSIMWGSIFNLAVEGLGKYTAQASGIFMMMVVGGGLMPLLQNYIADLKGYMDSYWLVVAMLAYIFFYALIGSKNVNTDIPTLEEETIDPRSL